MAEYKCGDCFYADLCEESEILDGFNRDNPAYCSMFLNSDDVANVRHGRWTVKGYACGETEYQCSECKETEWRTSASMLKYCPFCGAKMDGGAE